MKGKSRDAVTDSVRCAVTSHEQRQGGRMAVLTKGEKSLFPAEVTAKFWAQKLSQRQFLSLTQSLSNALQQPTTAKAGWAQSL